MKSNTKELIRSVTLPLVAGGLSAFLTKDGMKAFEYLRKPPLSPPQWIFPVVWTALYAAMGVAAYQVKTSGAPQERIERSLTAYYIQLALNFVWPLLFFGMGLYLWSFCELVILWVAAAVTLISFRFIRKNAGGLLIPYVVWLTAALYLNWGVYVLN